MKNSEPDKEKNAVIVRRFAIGYDDRPETHTYMSDVDFWYVYKEHYTLSADITVDIVGCLESFLLTLKIFQGGNSDNDVSLLPLYKIIKPLHIEVDKDKKDFFTKRLKWEEKLPCPPQVGEVNKYTAQLLWQNQQVAVHQFQIVHLPSDLGSVFLPEKIQLRGCMLEDLWLECHLTLQMNMEFLSPVAISLYYTYLKEGGVLFEKEPETFPTQVFKYILFEKDQPVTIKFDFEDDIYSLEEEEFTPYIFITIGSEVLLKIPSNEISPEIKGKELIKYVQTNINQHNPDEEMSNIDFFKTAATEEKADLLAPKNFLDLLSFLDKKRIFDNKRSGNGFSELEVRRNYVFTGKRGTGKETAARELFRRLKEANDIDSFVQSEAIDFLDTTNGYSPKLEEFIDRNHRNFIYISNAEAFMLKGAVGSLNGIEILANKLRTVKDVIVVLSGKKGQVSELINMCETAREMFYIQYHFDDVLPERLNEFAVRQLAQYGYTISVPAKEKMLAYFTYAYQLRGNNFSNIYYAYNVIGDFILPNLINRVVDNNLLGADEINRIEAEDIPRVEERDPAEALSKLESLIGLTDVKRSIFNHTSLVHLNRLRSERGFYNKMPPMHMVFTGNPGTGKTTIAKYLGEIYRGIGALSSGHLVETDRSKLVGQYLGETEKNTLNAIERASGGVLFIDEAYNLFVEGQDKRDFGHRVIETLLTYLSLEDTDMIVILAGYTNEMKQLLESNPGLKSRFPYIFHFEDYSPEQLMNIGKKVLEKEQYNLSSEAEMALSKYVIEEYNNKDDHFGNGRFITRLLISHIIPALSQRLSNVSPELLTMEALSTIEVPDIPNRNRMLTESSPIDETILKNALQQLDELIGLESAKKALRNYTTISKLKHAQGNLNPKTYNYYWHFIGSTGTGKSTVAEILARILQGLGILKRGHFVSLNIEEFINSNQMFNILENALKRANNGLLFLDMDSPEYKDKSFDSARIWIENKVREINLNLAVVFAETGDKNEMIAKNLAKNGIVTFNQTIVFNDYNAEQLLAIFKNILKKTYCLDLEPDAEREMKEYIQQITNNSKNNFEVNARTMLLLAQAAAQIAQLRIVETNENPHKVIFDDVHNFEWDNSTLKYRKVGYFQ